MRKKAPAAGAQPEESPFAAKRRRLVTASWVSFVVLAVGAVVVAGAEIYNDTWGDWSGVLAAFAVGLAGGTVAVAWDRLPLVRTLGSDAGDELG